jgi:AraC family 4-hydroxyphenylacetate 3-monooxygenase operon regulatory protein
MTLFYPSLRRMSGLLAEARLNDICRRIAGLPSKRLVFDRLMQEAKRLRLFTGSSVNEICYQLGFKDPAYFSRFFTRNAGVTPGEYRVSKGAVE